MLKLENLRDERGSVIVTAMLVMLIMIPIGLALLSIVDTQARDSGSERDRDRAFNLADSALQSTAFILGRSGWPASGATAPSNTATSSAQVCAGASFGATLGAATNTGSTTARLQPNLNATYDDSAYAGATWQINVCDNDPSGAGPLIWKDALLSNMNYDANGDEQVWVRSESNVKGRRRVLAALVRVSETPAFASKYGLMTGRLNADLTNTVGTVLNSGLVGNLTSGLLGSDPLVAPDPSVAVTVPPASGVTAVRCGVLDGCLTGALAATSALPLIGTMITGGKLVQATSPTATSEASIAQLKQEAIRTNTYVATTSGSSSSSAPPACTIPAGANANTIVYIDQVGTTGTAGTVGGPGDQFCRLSVSTNVTYKALVIGRGRIVLRGNNTTNSGTVNTFRGLLYATNEQRETLGDAATPTREVIRIDQGARVVGGVAADGKSAQVGIYPPPLCTSVFVLGIDIGCTLSALTSMLNVLSAYNPAITSDAAVMNAIKTYDRAAVVAGTYRDLLGELH